MLRWALLSLWMEPGRALGSALGVGFAFTLVVLFQAVFEGESDRIVAYPENAGADVWVMQRGVSNMHMASSILWDWKETRVGQVQGVKDLTPILYLNSVVRAGKRDWFCYIVGLPPNAERGGPWRMASGRAEPRRGEVVIPRTLASLAGIGIGDQVAITDLRLTVVGLSDETFSMANSVTFVAMEDLEDIMGAYGYHSYLLVVAEVGEKAEALAHRIMREVDKVSALPRDRFVARDRKMALAMGTEIIWIMTRIGGLVAMLIVAFAAYSQVARLQGEYAVVKALGFRGSQLAMAALVQSITVTLAGLLVCVAVSYLVIPALPKLAPQVSVLVTGGQLARVALAALPVAAIASMLPIARIARVDPMSVFRT